MDPMLAGTIAAPVIGGVLGSISASSGRQAAAAAAQAALAQLNSLGVPPDLSQQLILQHYQSQGVLTPELQQDIALQSSEVGAIKEDPNLRNANMEALNTLGQVSRGGLQAGDRAAYNELRQQTQRDAEAQRQSILQRMQASGHGGDGNELIAQLQASQGAADQASSQGDRLAAQASQNALAALAQRSNLANTVRGQDFNVNQARAQALDDRNKFLYTNSANRQAANVQAMNNAQQANLANSQRLSEMNVGQANQETQRANQAKEQQWQNQLQLATAKANALNNQGTVLQNNANSQANMFSGMGNAVGQGFATFGKKTNSQSSTPQLTKEQTSYVPTFDSSTKYDANGNRLS